MQWEVWNEFHKYWQKKRRRKGEGRKKRERHELLMYSDFWGKAKEEGKKETLRLMNPGCLEAPS